jgi:hypothetical protein
MRTRVSVARLTLVPTLPLVSSLHMDAVATLGSCAAVLPTDRTKSLAWVGLVPGPGVPSGLVGLVGLVGVRPRAYCSVADN